MNTSFKREVNQAGTAIRPIRASEALVRNLAIPAEAAGRSDLLPYGPGKVPIFQLAPTYWLSLASLVEEVSEIGAPIIQWSAARRESNS